jgi:hypothetical protein
MRSDDITQRAVYSKNSPLTCPQWRQRRFLWKHRNGLRDAVDAQARLSLLDAVAQYVEAISGQHGERLDMLLAHTGLNGSDAINGTEVARRLGVSHQRVYQIVQQLYRARDRACPPAGIWMPQLDAADEAGWPTGISAEAQTAIRGFAKSEDS